ncbi:SNARE associated Golgi protein [Thraustotheca clavata]|uniref:SNARE associated Golgi protein n=1 Tax=Thraustotheca clavata TaxID=74557 RepID=A0A1V9Y5E4_9STRA|nr:SNARE associated Golgi protein [Thraustotheca clavata]
MSTGTLALLACAVATGVYYFFSNAPIVEIEACHGMSLSFLIKGVLPTWLGGRDDKLGTVKALWECASLYQELHANFVLTSFIVVYVTLQTFAIPGPIILSILSGALYPFLFAQILVAACATTGASLCFLLSHFLGRSLVQRSIPTMIANFKEKIAQNRGNLFYYLLFLRLTPLLPNWFVNVASPLVDVPFGHFVLATFIGLMPANFIHISTGATLNNATEAGSNNFVNFAILFSLQFVALLPTLFKSKLQALDDQKQTKED